VNSLALQSDGKVVVGGAFDTVNGQPRNNIARLNTNGDVDTGFVPNVGVAGAGLLAGVNALAVQSDDKILLGGDFTSVAGSPRTNIARLTALGSLDPAFNAAAVADSPVSAIALDANSKIVISGFFTHVNGGPRNYLARLDSSGGLDNSFTPGTGPSDPVYAATVQPDTKVLIGGAFTNYTSIARHGIARLNGDLMAQLLNPVWSGGTFSASVATDTGKTYLLEYKNSFNDTTWTTLPGVAGDGTVKNLTDPSATVSRRFYRVEVQ